MTDNSGNPSVHSRAYFKPMCIAVAVVVFLYFLLPATSQFFYESYHFTHFEFLYWLYSGFKVAAVFFPRWEFFELSVITAGLATFGLSLILQRRRHTPA